MTLDELIEKETPKAAPKARASSGSAVMDVAASLTPPGMAEAVGNFAKPSILPTAGSIALPAALTALAGPANAPFIPLEQGVGSGLGEGANQLLGITEPSLTNIGISAALPTALGYGANALRALKTVVPPSAGAETLNALAPKEAFRKVAGYAPAQKSEDLFKIATETGARIETPHTLRTINSMLDELTTPSKGAQKEARQVISYLHGLKEKLVPKIPQPTTPAGRPYQLTAGEKAVALKEAGEKAEEVARSLTPLEIQQEMRAAGELIKTMEKKGGGGFGAIKKVFSSLSDDLDTALPKAMEEQGAVEESAVMGAKALSQARKVFKREQVLESIDDVISSAFKINRGQGASGQFNANKVINTLQDEKGQLGKFFHQAFTGAERKDLVDFFKFLNTIPSLKPGAGQQYGSGRAIRDVLAPATAAGGAGFAGSGGDPLVTGLATAAGALAPQAAESVTLLRQVWSLPGGRAMLKGLLANSDGALTPKVMGALGAFLSGQSSGANVSPSGTVRPFPMEQ